MKLFNIKKISITLFAFLCMFFTVKNVEAGEKYVCYYVDPALESELQKYTEVDTGIVFKGKVLLQLTFENNKASFKYYDSTSKTTHNGISSDVSSKNVISISPHSGSQLTIKDFENGCPGKMERMNDYYGDGYVYDIFKEGTEEYKQFRKTKLKDSVFAKMDSSLQNSNDYCYSDGNVGYYTTICDVAMLTNIPETQVPTEKEKNLLSCSYTNETILIQDGTISSRISLSIDLNKKNISVANKWNSDSTVSFSVNQLDGNCPNEIYTNTTDYKIIYLTKNDVPKNETANKFSLIKTMSLGNIQSNIQSTSETGTSTGCEALGGLKKYLQMAYKLLRYLVPIIIIIFSALDFVGVILSGENEKMEKAKKRFAIRLITGVSVLLVPAILELLLKLSGIIESNETLVDVACQIF